MQRVRFSSKQASVHKLGDSQMTLSPKFRLLSSEMRFRNSSMSEFEPEEPLIPGLPDDVALNCLLRTPVQTHSACRTVCKRWHLLLGTKESFFSKRKELGFKDPWLFVFAFHKYTGKIVWQVLDLIHYSWHTIPPMPNCKNNDKVCPHGFRTVSVRENGTVFVCGGTVLKYEVVRNRWSVMKKMIRGRSFFGCGVIDGMVYVAGGNSEEEGGGAGDMFEELNSGEVMDPVKGCWSEIPSMGANMAAYDAAVLDGKLLVTEGWLWPFCVSPRGQVYDPRRNEWEEMAVGLREGWTGWSVVIEDNLFVVSEIERMKLKVYDTDSDKWDVVVGAALPDQICKPFTVTSHHSKIYVVGRKLNVAVGYISRINDISSHNNNNNKCCRFSVRWKVVVAPNNLSHLTPSSSQVLLA